MNDIDMEIKRIHTIKFTLMSQDKIRCGPEINKSQLRDENNKIVRGGLFDPRMGPVNKEDVCEKCRGSKAECSGHFGYIELVRPVYNPIYMSYILKILKCICPHCKRLYCSDDVDFLTSLKSRGEQRFVDIRKHIENTYSSCHVLKTKKKKDSEQPTNEDEQNAPCDQPLFSYSAGKKPNERFTVFRKLHKQPDVMLTPIDVLNIFTSLYDEDVYYLGLDPEESHPKDMIFKALPVCPPSVRPTAARDKGKTGEDDLTLIYQSIITANNNLKDETERFTGITEEGSRWLDLQMLIAMLFMKGVKYDGAKKKKYKSIEERLSGKQGRLRLNLMGKRVDFSARTVISPDPNLSMDEVGVPIGIAKVLTFPERVTKYNINEMQKLVHNGVDMYPGACKLEKKNGTTYILSDDRKREVEIGDVVHRYLRDGDYVIFNRQPSLHRMSMMGHRVRVLPFSTFRMNLCDTTPYNADFDGDEMNLHVPQTLEARAELATLMLTPTQIITPEKNSPIMGIVQDTQCGSYIITKRETFIEQTIFYNILQWLDNFNGIVPIPAILKPVPKWTGKQVFTRILPDLNFHRGDFSIEKLKEQGPCLEDDAVYIHNGIHMTGYLCNKTGFGRSNAGIIHSMWKDCGMMKTKEFFNKTQQTVNSWILTRGFTVGVGDIIVKDEVHQNIRNEINKTFELSQDYISHKDYKKYATTPGYNMFEKLENGMSDLAVKLNKKGGEMTAAALRKNNNLLQMVNSGSKGSMNNIIQMIAFVGKQEINNARIDYGFYKRTLPHYWKEDYGFVSRGFVTNGFLKGLTPQEMFFHAMAGRQGIIDTAVKTAETGYIQRRLVKNMEDVQSKYDRTVRRTTGDLVQFMYGGEGYDGLMCETQQYPYCFKTKDDTPLPIVDDLLFKKKYEWDMSDPTLNTLIEEDILKEMYTEEYKELFENEIKTLKAEREELFSEIRQALDLKVEDVHVPVNFERQINNVIAKQYLPRSEVTNLDPKYVIEQSNELMKRLSEVQTKKGDKWDMERSQNSLKTFITLYHSYLSSKQCIYHYHLTKQSFNDLLERIEKIYLKGQINPGEMVGSIAAQSIGAPATQMTLNTFHHAGTSSANVTQGVPRLKELLNMSKVPKTPSMNLYLNYGTDETMQDLNKELKLKLCHTKLNELVTRAEIWFYPDMEEPLIPEDNNFLQNYLDDLSEIERRHYIDNYSKWTIRFVLEYNKIIASGIEDVYFIAEKIKEYFDKYLVVISPRPINTAKHEVVTVIYVRIPRADAREPSDKDSLRSHLDISQNPFEIQKKVITEILDTVELFGVEGVHKVIVPKDPKSFTIVNPQTKLLEEEKQWVVSTEGSNLKAMRMFDKVDFTKSTSNNVFEVSDIFGIEAGRLQLAREFLQTLSGSYVNYRHLGLLADVMTATGRLQPINRFGLSRGNAGVITRASFEQTLAQFKQAAAFQEADILNGVSQNILLGQRTIVGSGSFTVLIDIDTLKSMHGDGIYDADLSDNVIDRPQGKNILDGISSPIRQINNLMMSPSRKDQIVTPIRQNTSRYPASPGPRASPFPIGYQPSPMPRASPNPMGYQPSPMPRASPFPIGYQPSPMPRASPNPMGYQPSPMPRASPNIMGYQPSPFFISNNNTSSSPYNPASPATRSYNITQSSPSIGFLSSPMTMTTPAYRKTDDKK